MKVKDGRQLRRHSAECAAMVASDRTAGTAYGHGGEGPLESLRGAQGRQFESFRIQRCPFWRS